MKIHALNSLNQLKFSINAVIKYSFWFISNFIYFKNLSVKTKLVAIQTITLSSISANLRTFQNISFNIFFFSDTVKYILNLWFTVFLRKFHHVLPYNKILSKRSYYLHIQILLFFIFYKYTSFTLFKCRKKNSSTLSQRLLR